MYLNGKLADRRELLKIKLASLVHEAHLIRRAENRQRAFNRKAVIVEPILLHEMTLHRRTVVRGAARLTGIALGMIRGRRIGQLETIKRDDNILTDNDWNSIAKMVSTYGNQEAVKWCAHQRADYMTLASVRKAKKAAMPAY